MNHHGVRTARLSYQIIVRISSPHKPPPPGVVLTSGGHSIAHPGSPPPKPWPLILGFLAPLLALPPLKTGLVADDHFRRAVLLHRGEMVVHLSAFVKPGEPAALMRELGCLPWWSDSAVSIAPFRPLAALTQVLEQALCSGGLVMQHLHSSRALGNRASGAPLRPVAALTLSCRTTGQPRLCCFLTAVAQPLGHGTSRGESK